MMFIYTKSTKLKGINTKTILNGNWGIQSLSYGTLTETHIKLLYFMSSKVRVKLKLNYNLNKVHTKKPLETRMGGGKSSISNKSYFIKPGDILIEIYKKSSKDVYLFLKECIYKLPIKLKLIKLIY